MYKSFLIGVVSVVVVSFTSVVMAHDGKKMSTAEHSTMASEMMIHKPWSRALPPVATNGAAYLIVHNNGKMDDRVLSVSSPIAKRVMMHQSVSNDGRVSMQHVESVVVKAGEMIEFRPGGYHVMLMGLTRPLVAGESFPMTIHFEHAGKILTTVKIKKQGQESASKHHH